MKQHHSPTSRNKLMLVGICLVFLVILILPWCLNLSGSSTAAQTSGKTLEKLESYPNEPLNFAEIKAANKAIRLGEGFNAGEDWLRNASFKVTNVSGKEIVYIEIDVNFPDTKSSGNEMSYRLKFGHRPAAHDSNPSLILQPDGETILALQGEKYDRLARFVEERQPISTIRRATIRIGFVIFADGTGWSGGQFQRQDPTNPNRYIPVPN